MFNARLGQLTILAPLGNGAGSQVFHVRRERDSLECALKIVVVDTRTRWKFLEQIRQEFRVGQLLDHPNLIKMYALEIERNWWFRPRRAKLLSEHVAGRSADKLPLLTPTRLLRMFQRVADAVGHMHDRGICHADMKPDNLILGPKDVVKVIDYGLARIDGEPGTRVQGTPEYMAPETKLRKVVNRRTDIFNFGATMYRLVTLRHLPVSAPGIAMSQKAFGRLVVPVSKLNPAISDRLCEIIHWCISYEPEERPRTIGEVRSALKEAARDCADL
ncbi:MAG: serine/threonine protein kinase [Planctomycetes bacterium]|nr:serine/threonine protein kinase [Planctomycetota bacterium]